MKIAIATVFRNANYGATLQAYALAKSVQKLANTECYFIDYRRKETINMFRCSLWDMDINGKKKLSIDALKRTIRQCINPLGTIYRFYKFEIFRKDHLLISEKIYYKSEQIRLPDTEMLILGSDQIWNPDVTHGFNDVYFGKLCNSDVLTVSYAASFGKTEFSDEEKKQLKELLANVDIISVREEEGAELLSELMERNIVCVPDPTVLIDRTDWVKLASTAKGHGSKYVMIYMLTYNEEVIYIGQCIAKKLGCEIVLLGSGSSMKIKGMTEKKFDGPTEFLKYVAEAEYVVTNSFHGMIFSVIFNKQFYTVPHETRGSRMINFAKKVGLEDRIIYKSCTLSEKNLRSKIDYNLVNVKFNELKQIGIDFLNYVIKVGRHEQV